MILAYEPTRVSTLGPRFDIYVGAAVASGRRSCAARQVGDPWSSPGCGDRVLVMSRGQIIEEIPGTSSTSSASSRLSSAGRDLAKACRSQLGIAMPMTSEQTGS